MTGHTGFVIGLDGPEVIPPLGGDSGRQGWDGKASRFSWTARTRRRRHITRRVACLLLGISIGATVGLVWLDFDRRVNHFECHRGRTPVRDGDTLWAIAHDLCWGNKSLAVDALVDRYGTNIYVGQWIVLP